MAEPHHPGSSPLQARVAGLIPGDRVTNGPMSAVFICQVPHPLWPSLRLVIWYLGDGTYSFDALSIHQEVGTVNPADTQAGRKSRLHRALLGGRGGGALPAVPVPAEEGAGSARD